MMASRTIAAAALGVLIIAATAGSSAGQTITFTKPANSPDGIAVRVLEGLDDVSPAVVQNVDDGWTYEARLSPSRWRNDLIFLIDLPKRNSKTDAYRVSSDAVTLELHFSFTPANSDDHIEVPIELFRGVGYNERKRIDDMSQHEQYQKILLSQALAEHYLHKLVSPQDGFTKYMMRVWFETLYAAIVHQHRPLAMDPRLEPMTADTFSGDRDSIRHFSGAMAQVREATWLQMSRLPALLSNDDCEGAKALVSYLEQYHQEFPEMRRRWVFPILTTC